MQHLSPQQAQALWDAGGFIILPDLPEGSEYGLDGTYRIIRSSFTGSKFVPSGLHLITWSPPSSGSGPGALPIRSGILVYLRPRERLLLHYNASTESLSRSEEAVVISDDHLRSIDPGLAPYSFEGLERWKSLTSEITGELASQILGLEGKVDGMRGVQGDKEDDGFPQGQSARKDDGMRFAEFDLRRSWREGAVGEEVTRYSRDKSWLLGHVIGRLTGGPLVLLGHLQFAFILLLHLSSYPALKVYKRIVSLLTRSSSVHTAHTTLNDYNYTDLYINLIRTLSVQLDSLPEGVFDTELPELDVWYLEEMEIMRINLLRGLGVGGIWSTQARDMVVSEWAQINTLTRRKFGWNLGAVDIGQNSGQLLDDEEEEEEGEYAPVIVEI